jgi:hypothetical protein
MVFDLKRNILGRVLKAFSENLSNTKLLSKSYSSGRNDYASGFFLRLKRTIILKNIPGTSPELIHGR